MPFLEQEEPGSDVDADIITTALIQSLIRTGGSTTELGVIAIINSLMDDHAVRPSLFSLGLALIFEDAEQLQEKLVLSISSDIVNLMDSGSIYVVLTHLIGAVAAAEENVEIKGYPLTLNLFKDRLVNIIEYDNLEVLSEIDAMIDECEGELILALEDKERREYCNDVLDLVFTNRYKNSLLRAGIIHCVLTCLQRRTSGLVTITLSAKMYTIRYMGQSLKVSREPTG